MTIHSDLAIGPPVPVDGLDEPWTVELSLVDSECVLPNGGRLANRGELRGFFHGVLFNREAIRDSDRSLPTDCSDVDLVLSAYERWGEAAFPRLRGSFAVGVIDRQRGIAILARDQLGLHPLFYVEHDSRLIFAASARALLKLPNVPRSLNRVALADHLCSRWPDVHETFFAAVRRLPPGWRATLAGGRFRVQRYWNPVAEDRPVEWLTSEETRRFDNLLDQAVDRCLGRTNEPHGIFLSGGLDSVCIAAVATDRARRIDCPPPLALSLAFPDPKCDESDVQASVAHNLGLRQHLLRIKDAVGCHPLFEQALALSSHYSSPVQNFWLPAYLEMARRARLEGVQRILTGHGGDEWLTVSPDLAADLIRRGQFVELAQFYRALRRSNRSGPLALARALLWTSGLRSLVGSFADWLMPKTLTTFRVRRTLHRRPSWVAPDPELRREQASRAVGALRSLNPPQGFYSQEVRAGLDHPLVSMEMEEQYETGNLTGARLAHPFLDADLVEMLLRVPPRLLNEGGLSKGLVRGSLARRFPALGFDRQRKISATSYFDSCIIEAGSGLSDVVGDFPTLSKLGVVDGPAARTLFVEALKRPGPELFRIFLAVGLEIWARSCTA